MVGEFLRVGVKVTVERKGWRWVWSMQTPWFTPRRSESLVPMILTPLILSIFMISSFCFLRFSFPILASLFFAMASTWCDPWLRFDKFREGYSGSRTSLFLGTAQCSLRGINHRRWQIRPNSVSFKILLFSLWIY